MSNQGIIDRRKQSKGRKARPNTVTVEIDMSTTPVSESAVNRKGNKARAGSAEANTSYADLKDYASLEEKLREAREAADKKKVGDEIEAAKPKQEKGKDKKAKKEEGEPEEGEDTEGEGEEEADDAAFLAGDDEDE